MELTPTRVPGRNPSPRLVLGVLGIGLAAVVAVGIFGRDFPAPSRATPPPAAAATLPATPRVTSQPTSPTPPASPATSRPMPTPLGMPREGVPTVTRSTAHVLDEPRGFFPSGIETLSPDTGSYARVVVGADGGLWAVGSGRLTRYDPARAMASTWTVDDDLRFVANDIAPARAGGVWLIGTRTVRRLDSRGFSAAFDVEADLADATEGPDGSLWAATFDGTIVHLVGSSRFEIDALRPNADAAISAIAVDAAGGVWCGWVQYPGPPWGGWVSRYDGSAWRTFDAEDAPPLGGTSMMMVAPADGSILVATTAGLARFDGSSWTDLTAEAPRLANVASVAKGPDGATWVGTGDLGSGAPTVGRLADGSWTLFGPSDGLPEENGSTVDWIVPSGDQVFVGTGAGIYELAGSRWRRAWPAGPEAGPGGGTPIAVSRDEAWVAEGSDVWHFVDGGWTGPLAPSPGGYVRALLRAPDGMLWAGVDSSGPYVLEGSEGSWRWIGTGSAESLAVDRDGVVWAAGRPSSTDPQRWAVRSFGYDGRAWKELAATRSTDLIAWPARLVIGSDGTVWVGSQGAWGIKPGLVRYVDGRWELVHPRGGSAEIAIWDLAVAPNGDVWVVGGDVAPGNEAPPGDPWLARFDGTAWTIFDEGVGPPMSYGRSIAAAPDGSIWAATGHGLARFDGTAWTVRCPGPWFSGISVAPDGTIWVSGPAGIARLRQSAASP